MPGLSCPPNLSQILNFGKFEIRRFCKILQVLRISEVIISNLGGQLGCSSTRRLGHHARPFVKKRKIPLEALRAKKRKLLSVSSNLILGVPAIPTKYREIFDENLQILADFNNSL